MTKYSCIRKDIFDGDVDFPFRYYECMTDDEAVQFFKDKHKNALECVDRHNGDKIKCIWDGFETIQDIQKFNRRYSSLTETDKKNMQEKALKELSI